MQLIDCDSKKVYDLVQNLSSSDLVIKPKEDDRPCRTFRFVNPPPSVVGFCLDEPLHVVEEQTKTVSSYALYWYTYFYIIYLSIFQQDSRMATYFTRRLFADDRPERVICFVSPPEAPFHSWLRLWLIYFLFIVLFGSIHQVIATVFLGGWIVSSLYLERIIPTVLFLALFLLMAATFSPTPSTSLYSTYVSPYTTPLLIRGLNLIQSVLNRVHFFG